MLTINGQHILSQSRIADELNKAFVKIPQMVNSDRTTLQFEQCHSAITDFVNMRVPPMVEFSIPQVTTTYVLKELKELNIKKATGCDDISAQFLKTSASVIAPLICDLINESINTSTFPDMWKVAKVKAAFKGSQTEVDNYRPLAILCVISKIIEKHIHTNFS